MRTILSIALAVSLCALLYGCSNSTPPETTKDDKAGVAAATNSSKKELGFQASKEGSGTSAIQESKPGEKPTTATAGKPTKDTKKMDFVTTESGLRYKDEVVGTGECPKKGQLVVVHYRGTLDDGTQFDSSYDKGNPYRFNIGLRQVVQGWDEGIITMKVGGKRKLVLPASLGYGDQPNGPIPASSTLHFDVELLEIH